MATVHLEANPHDYADAILICGDPNRAKHLAETFLHKPRQVNAVRGMLGFTGEYLGKPVSIQSVGMGIPSLLIYGTELIKDFGAKRILRLGTCGALSSKVPLGSAVCALSAATDSGLYHHDLGGHALAPCCSYEMLQTFITQASSAQVEHRVGQVLTSDVFYNLSDESWKKWARHGALAVEMETAGLYYLGGLHGIDVLSILFVTDDLTKKRHDQNRYDQAIYNTLAKLSLTTLVQ